MSWHKKIIGHTANRKYLESLSESQKMPYSFLFVGPKEIGKFRIAKSFVQMLNSNDQEVVREIEKNICSDVMVMGDLWQKDKLESWDRISKTSNFDQRHRSGKGEGETPRRKDIIGVRDIQKFLDPLYRQGKARWKAGVIRDAHRMNMESSNALLKTLEEPPENTLFVLTATHKKSLPETVVSRCQVISFSLHTQDILKEYLETEEIPQEKQEDLLMISQGRSEHLFRLLDDSDFFESEKRQFQEISRLFFLDDPLQKMKKAELLSAPEKQDELSVFFGNFTRFLRSILVEKTSGKPFDISQKIDFLEIAQLFESLSNVKKGLRANANRRLLLEKFFFSIP